MEFLEQTTTVTGDPSLNAWFAAAALAAVGTVVVVLLWLKLRHRRDLGGRVLQWLLGRRPTVADAVPREPVTESSPPVQAAEPQRKELVQDLNRALAAYQETRIPEEPVQDRSESISEARLNEYLNRLRAAADRLELLAETPRHTTS